MLSDQDGYGGVVADYHMLNKTDMTCQQVNLGMVAYLGTV